MKWYKHSCSMRFDTKVRRAIQKYGADAYSVYASIVESIADGLDPSNQIIPYLQENSEDIAYYFKIDTLRVEEIVNYFVSQGLFEQDKKGMVYCFKLYHFVDEYFCKTSNNNPNGLRNKQIVDAYKLDGLQTCLEKIAELTPKNISIISSLSISDMSGHNPDNVHKCLPEETRPEETRIEENIKEGVWTLKDLIKMIDFWNDSKYSLPKYPKSKYKTGINIPDIHDLLKNLSFFTREQISQSIINYSKILNDNSYKAFPTYPTAISFLIKGIESYYDDAKPFERCLKSGEIKKKKIDDKRQKNRPSHCKQCETKINEKNTKISISTMQCRECETIYKWNGHEWIVDK